MGKKPLLKADIFAAMPALQCGCYALDLSEPRIMGVLNVTPDSFSDGGKFTRLGAAIDQALRMQDEGADLIDIGGESTRPGAAAVSLDEERRRILPLLEALTDSLQIPVSVDTSKPDLMIDAIAAGAGMINDVNALRGEGALEALAGAPDVACVIMHMQGEPRTMQKKPHYDDVVAEVADFLQQRKEQAVLAGIRAGQIVVDPGIGFGKSLAHNLQLLKASASLVREFGAVLVGVSRKSMFSHLLGERGPAERIAASVQTAMLCAQAGAAILRVHDVKQTQEALQLLQAIQSA